MSKHDPINHPPHYQAGDAVCSKCGHGIECIDITRHQDNNTGNAFKYLWRYKSKGGVEDLKKAVWYINDLIAMIEK